MNPSSSPARLPVLVGLILLASSTSLCRADAPIKRELPESLPKIVLDAGDLSDATLAMGVAERFYACWEQKQVDEACELVSERSRPAFREYMMGSQMEPLRIDRVRLFSYQGLLLARVHTSQRSRRDRQGPGWSLDMVYRDGRWWVTVR